MKPLLLVVSLILPLALSLTLQEDDLVFDDVGEPAVTGYGPPNLDNEEHREYDRKHERSKENKKHNVQRLWGIPDTSVIVGHVFKMRILRQAFSGNVDHFQARGMNGQPLPYWLDWDEAASTLVGVPSKKESGIHHVTIKAFGKHGDIAKDVFSINVVAEKKDEVVHKDGKTHCDESEDQTLLTIVLDTKFENLKPSMKVNAIENLAGFLGLHTSAFSMHPYTSKETSHPDASVILSGPGNVKHRREKHSTSIQWQVGCDGRLWHHQTDLVRQLRDQAKDGTLAEVLQQPVLSWRVKTDSSSLLRNRREAGSGDFGGEDYEDYNYDYEDEDQDPDQNGDGDVDGDGGDDDESVTEQPQISIVKSNVDELERPHRHHHGDKTIDPPIEENIDVDELFSINPRTFPVPNSLPIVPVAPITTTTTAPANTTTAAPLTTTTTVASTTTTTTQIPITVTTTPSTTTSTTLAPTTTTESSKVETMGTPEDKIDNIVPTIIAETTTILPNTAILQNSSANNEMPTSAATPAIKSVYDTTVSYNQTTAPQETTEHRIQPNTTLEPETTPITITTTTTTTETPTTTIPPPTTTQRLTTLPRTTPVIISEITEKIEHRQYNFPPREDRTLQKLHVTAGKPLSFIIPNDTFSDMEDGNTRQLSLNLLWQNNSIKPDHWLQFDRKTQEVYGLPHENMISKWDYKLVAEDSEGLNATADLDVHVQQHKLTRAVNHEFSIYLKIEKHSAFPTNVDWQLKVVRSLVQLYGDRNSDQITVRNIHFLGDQAIFTWYNDSLPRDSACPKEQIDKLLHVLVANEREEPSIALQDALAPEIKVKRVVYQGNGQCEDFGKPVTPSVVTEEPKENQPPVPRNQVDHIDAIVGQLLEFTVPTDTFFDKEDGSTRNMNLTLMTSTRSSIPETNWLQFDSKNQQFYGVPMQKDIGRKEYQLIVTDRNGASITDGLVVVVQPSTISSTKHNVEFSMTLEIPYASLANSAAQKRKFIEKIGELFHERNLSAISLDSITEIITEKKGIRENTVVTWHNKTLATEYCPHDEITQLREVLGKDENRLTDRVHQVMGPDFLVTQVTLTPSGYCLGGEQPSILSPSVMPPFEDTTSVGKSHDDLIITFIVPAIIIAAMLILAGIIACILYRRKRSGKMSVSEQDDERQSFRNKGIPVIFQDELDEKPDPGNKSPVILKEEKPPLPPPEYQKTEDGADVPMLQSENSEEPYQPPPPFATNRENNRQNRPKPTPTYRKPPPYVPP